MLCINCKAFHADKKQCRLNPPQASIVMTQGFGGQVQPAVLTFYPEVSDDFGCEKGEVAGLKLVQ